MRQQWLVFLPVTLATAGLAACASVLGGEEIKVRPVDTLAAMGAPQRDSLYESAVAAINDRDYGRALDYLQAAKAKDPRNVKALNALGVVYDKLGRFDLSARYYAQAHAIEPDSKIVAENVGYSKVLQRLLNPNQPIAVAAIDLPPDLIKSVPSAATAPVADKTAVPNPAAAAPAPASRTIETSPHVAAATPFAPPDASQFFSSIVLPQPVPPVPEKKVVDARAPTLATAQFGLPDTKSLLAYDILSEPVVTQRQVIDTPRPAATAMPVTLAGDKPFFATAVLPEMIVPVTERKVIDTPPPAMTAAPLVLAEAKPFFATAALPELALPVTEKRVIDSSPPVPSTPFVLPDVKPLFAASLSPAPLAATENRDGQGAAPSAATVPAAAPAKVMIASVAPARVETKAAPAPLASVVEVKTVAAPVLPAAAISTSLAKPVVVASASPAVVRPSAPKPTAVAAAVPAVSPSPAKPVAPIPARNKTVPTLPAVAAAPRPVTIASHPVTAPAKPHLPVLKQAANAPFVPAKMAPNGGNKTGKILIGQPVRLFNASGKAGGTGTVLRRLTTLGWTMRSSDGRVQPLTVLYYSVQNIAAAKALQRTLPFPVRLTADKANNAGMRLVIGRDYLSWKPRNARIAALWQKGVTIASLRKASIKGVR